MSGNDERYVATTYFDPMQWVLNMLLLCTCLTIQRAVVAIIATIARRCVKAETLQTSWTYRAGKVPAALKS